MKNGTHNAAQNQCNSVISDILERLRNENEDETKAQMTQSFSQYSENEAKIWGQNILNQFNRVSSSLCYLQQYTCLLLIFFIFASHLRLSSLLLRSIFGFEQEIRNTICAAVRSRCRCHILKPFQCL